MAREVPCPRCGTQHPWDGNPWRPFCSERCKLIDLGGWLSGDNAIPGDAADIEAEDGGVRPLEQTRRDN